MNPTLPLLTALLLAPLAALHAADPQAPTDRSLCARKCADLPAQLPASIRPDPTDRASCQGRKAGFHQHPL